MAESLAEEFAFSGVDHRVRGENFVEVRQRFGRAEQDGGAGPGKTTVAQLGAKLGEGLDSEAVAVGGGAGNVLFRRGKLPGRSVVIGLYGTGGFWIDDGDFRSFNDCRRSGRAGKYHHRAPSGVDAYADGCWLH